jgi:2',3'-cyclic-nucleotide 2'-phosphodiesterase (5'-nucleotidase family)
VLGGLARRATVIKELKKEGKELLAVDAGNSLFKEKGSPSSAERKRARLLATTYRRIGYQAVNVGSNDLLAGIEFLKQLKEEVHLPLLSANLLDAKGGKPIFKTHMRIDLSGIRVGVVGLTSDVPHQEGVIPEGYFLSDPLTAANRMAAELVTDCDIIVALGNLGSFKEYTELVQKVEAIQFIFGSGGKGSYHHPIRSNSGSKATLFQTYAKGQYLGRIDLRVVKGDYDFVDLSRRSYLERTIKSVESQLESYRTGSGRAAPIPQDKRDEYIKRLEDFKKRSEEQLKRLEEESRTKSTFINTPIRLNDTIKEDPEIKELIDRFKKGSLSS